MTELINIPIFPLSTVLFPTGDMALNIFEERYRIMVEELLESGGVFGVILILRGEEVGGSAVPHSIGTTANIIEHSKNPDGGYALRVQGRSKFKLVRMLEDQPYPSGEIEFFPESGYQEPDLLGSAIDRVRHVFSDYVRLSLALTDQWAEGVDLPADSAWLINKITPNLGIPEIAKQRVLEHNLPTEGLRALEELLNDLVSRAEEQVKNHYRERYTGIVAAG